MVCTVSSGLENSTAGKWVEKIFSLLNWLNYIKKCKPKFGKFKIQAVSGRSLELFYQTYDLLFFAVSGYALQDVTIEFAKRSFIFTSFVGLRFHTKKVRGTSKCVVLG